MNRPALNKNLETFLYKKIISTWNSLSVDLKSTAEFDEFYELLKKSYLSNYSCNVECVGPCYSCGTHMSKLEGQRDNILCTLSCCSNIRFLMMGMFNSKL